MASRASAGWHGERTSGHRADAASAATDGYLPPIWSALKKANKYSKVGTPNHVVLSVDAIRKAARR
jgi:hypothetical protein